MKERFDAAERDESARYKSAAALFDNAVVFGSEAIDRVWVGRSMQWFEAPSLALLRQGLELAQGARASLFSNAPRAAPLLLRGMLEILWQIMYLHAGTIQVRAAAFFVGHYQRLLRELAVGDPDTKEFNRVRGAIDRDNMSLNFPRPKMNTEQLQLREQLVALLADARFCLAAEEYNSMVAKHPKRNPEWYSIGGGPSNIAALAEKVQQSYLYETMYRPYSASVHGTDVLQQSFEGGKLLPIGSLKDWNYYALHGINLTLNLILTYTQKNEPDYFAAAEDHVAATFEPEIVRLFG